MPFRESSVQKRLKINRSILKRGFPRRIHRKIEPLPGDETLVWSVVHDLESSALDEKEKALLRFVRQVTLAPASITAQDTQRLNAAGWDDASIFYAISACALFNFYNRWVSASGVHTVSDEACRRLAAHMAVTDYAR